MVRRAASPSGSLATAILEKDLLAKDFFMDFSKPEYMESRTQYEGDCISG